MLSKSVLDTPDSVRKCLLDSLSVLFGVGRLGDVLLRRCEGAREAGVLARVFATWAREAAQVTRPFGRAAREVPGKPSAGLN